MCMTECGVYVWICFRDDEEKKKSPSDGTDEKDNGNQSKLVSRISNSNNPFLDIPHDPNAAVYKTGFLARKIHADMDGKKSECFPGGAALSKKGKEKRKKRADWGREGSGKYRNLNLCNCICMFAGYWECK